MWVDDNSMAVRSINLGFRMFDFGSGFSFFIQINNAII
jgi:hypothetical protein